MNEIHVTVTGNVATPPELKFTSAGVPFAKFRVAVTERKFERSTGSWTDGPTSWYSASVFRALGEHAHASLKKGDRVVMSGRLRIRQWETASKQGADAEVDVEAIGHDLRWGTTRFERDPAQVPQAGAEDAAGGWSTAAVGADNDESTEDPWNAPLGSDGPGPSEPEGSSEALASTSAPTPF